MTRRRADPAWGLLAEFRSVEDLARAARRLRAQGYRAIDAHTPFPDEAVTEALALPRPAVGWVSLAAGLAGGAAALFVQWYANAVDYPLDVGGRPLDAWPAFAMPAFQVAVAVSAAVTLAALLVFNGLPRLHHPLFEVERFASATGGRFYLSVEARDPLYDRGRTRDLLLGLGARWVGEVPS